MEQGTINGGNQTFPTLSAGYALRSVAGGVDVALASNEGAADIIELTGVLTANIRVTVPTPATPQVVGTTPPPPVFPFTALQPALTANSWLKLVRNSTTGPFTVTIVGPGGSGVALGQGTADWFYSPDGVNVFAGSPFSSEVVAAIGLDFVFQPGGPVPTGAANIYTTEAALWTAVNAALGTVGGPLTIAVDSSHAAATFLLPHNGASRVSIVGANGGLIQDILLLADGATLTDLDIPNCSNIFLQGACVTAPALAFTSANPRFSPGIESIFEQLGAHAFIDLGAGQTMNLFGSGLHFVSASGTGFIGLTTGTSHLTTFATASSSSTQYQNFVFAPVLGATWTHEFDDTASVATLAAGSVIAIAHNQLSLASGEAYTPAVLVNWNGVAPTSVADALDRIAAKITPIP